jgi:PKD repeat protein
MISRWMTFLVLLSLHLLGCDSSTDPAPVVEAALSVLPISGDTDTQFTFNAAGSSSTAKSPSLEFRWDWEGDGSFEVTWSSASSQTHTYTSPGSYTPTVEVLDGGVTDQASVSLTVNPAVYASLDVSPESGTVLTDFDFDASASVSSSPGMGNLEFRWDFYDDGTWDTDWSSDPTITRRFYEGGYPVTRVEVRDGGGIGDASAMVTMNLSHGQIVDSILVDPTISPSGFAYDGEHFWFSQWGPDEFLVQVSSETGTILQSFPAHSNWTGGLAWDGTHLWQQSWVGEPVLVQIDPADGTAGDAFPVIYSRSNNGLCWDGEAFYFGSREKPGDGGDDKIHKYDKTGTELLVLDPPPGTEFPDALACDSESLYAIGRGVQRVFALDPATGAELYSWGQVGASIMTIADDHLWMWGWSVDDKRVIRKIVP